jgi:hypothetical protein
MLRATRWVVRHEGLALRGKGVADAPATIRTVTEAGCSGEAVLQFWASLGFGVDYELIRIGRGFLVLHKQHEMQVCARCQCMCVAQVHGRMVKRTTRRCR